MTKLHIYSIAAVLMIFTANSCKKGCTDPDATNYDAKAKKDDASCEYEVAPKPATVKLKVNHKVGTQTFGFNTTYQDMSGNNYQFTRAEMYLSNVTLLDDNMDTIEAVDKYFLISPNSSTTTHDLATLDGNTHVHMMNLSVGVDADKNDKDPAVLGVTYPDLGYQNPSMHWNWNSGYIFIVLEGKVDMDNSGTFDTGEDFVFHVGMNSMFRTNSGLMTHFNTTEGMTSNINLNMDWGKMFDNIDLSTENSTHTMNNMPLATKVADNAPNTISVQ